MTRIALVAGEVSGDYLAAGLIHSLKQRLPNAQFIGIAGSQMAQAGCTVCFAQQKLATMGFVETLGSLPEIYMIRRRFLNHLLAHPPDLMIGIDSPDFNLGLEIKLREQGIKTIHYVSPSVWAWRMQRIEKIKRAVHRILTLFPFETKLYQQHQIPVSYVGHPLADLIDLEPDQKQARIKLGLPIDKTIIGVFPGSRSKEIEQLGPVCCQAIRQCHQNHPQWIFISALATTKTRERFEQMLKKQVPDIPVTTFHQQSTEAMIAADLLVVASGTATLEALLCKRPMVVIYKLNALTYWYAKRQLTVKRFSLPNHLAGHDVVSELCQEEASAKLIAKEIQHLYEHPALVKQLKQEFRQIHRQLRCHANERAADAVMEVLFDG